MSLANGDVRTVLSDAMDTWQAQLPCFSACTCGRWSEQSRPRSPLLENSSTMTFSESMPFNGFQVHVHFSTRLLVMHLSTVSVPIGTAVSVGTSTKLTLAKIGHDKKIARGAYKKHVCIRVDNVMDSFISRTCKKRNFLDSREIYKMIEVLFWGNIFDNWSREAFFLF